MTRPFARKTHTLTQDTLFIVIVTILATPAFLAQVQATNSDRLSGGSSVVSGIPNAIATAQDKAVTPAHRRREKSGATPMFSGTLAFSPPLTFGSGGGFGFSITVADVNGDGIPDLLVANQFDESNGDGSVGVMLGNGDGTFQSAVIYDAGGTYSDGIAVADVNGDGKPDVIVVSQYPTGGQGGQMDGVVSVLLGNGDGTFRAAVTYDPGGLQTSAVAIADLDRDGKLDLIVTNTCPSDGCGYPSKDGIVSVLLGNGDGTFQNPVRYDSGGIGPTSIVAADVNEDGKMDLVVTNCGCSEGFFFGSGSVNILLGNGDGTVQAAGAYTTGPNPWWVAVADVNGDRHLDLVVANSCWCGHDASVSVLLGDGDGTFQAPVTYDSGGEDPFSITVGDVNGDGKPDVLVGDSCESGCPTNYTIGVLLGNGDGTFQPVEMFDSGFGGVLSIAVADINGDGRPDLLVTNALPGVGVLLNNTGSTDATTTTVASALNPSVFGQAVTFTAKVSSASGKPAGIVVFNTVSAQLGYETLAHGVASLSTTSVPAGTQSITASYLGSTTFEFSTSAPLSQVVNPSTTVTSIASSANPGTVKHGITYTSTVIGQYGGPVTGSVTFKDGGTTAASVGLSGNQAAYRTLYKTVGTHSITATYSGDGNNGGSTSATLTEDIVGPTKTVLTTSGSPSLLGQPVTFTATVSSTYGPIPNGELVTFL